MSKVCQRNLCVLEGREILIQQLYATAGYLELDLETKFRHLLYCLANSYLSIFLLIYEENAKMQTLIFRAFIFKIYLRPALAVT